MYKVIINDKGESQQVEIEFNSQYIEEFNSKKKPQGSSNSQGKYNGDNFEWDIIKVKDGSFHIIKDNRSYKVEVTKADYKEKNFAISVNGNKYNLEVKDRFDELLQHLGFDKSGSDKTKEIKAPMPGLVLDVIVREGMEIKKEDPIIVLEAMKMENILRAPCDGKIKEMKVKKGAAVEKNQVLVSLE